MRKSLLLAAAALTAGAIGASAQVYSANVVGYINVTCAPGLTLIANQLNNTNNTVGAIFPANLPEELQLWTWNGVGFDQTTYYGPVDGWDDPSVEFPPGTGGFINNPTATNVVITFVGEVMQGSLTNAYDAGLTLVGSIVPQAGNVETDLGLTTLAIEDQVWTWNGAGYDQYTYYGPVDGWDADPIVDVGEGFFISAASAGLWTRTFTVAP
jgi:hypothetical protein